MFVMSSIDRTKEPGDQLPSGLLEPSYHDGVAKNPISRVAAGSRNARRTTCTPPLARQHRALDIELFA